MQFALLFHGAYKCTRAVLIVLALMGLAALVGGCVLVGENREIFLYLDIIGDYNLKSEINYRLDFARGVGLVILGILFLIWSAVLMGCTICFKILKNDEVNAQRTHFFKRSRICTMIACIVLALAGVAIVLTGVFLITINPLYPYYGSGDGYPAKVDRNLYLKRAMDYAGGVMLIVLAVIFFVWTAMLAVCAYYLRKASRSETLDPTAPPARDPPPYMW